MAALIIRKTNEQDIKTIWYLIEQCFGERKRSIIPDEQIINGNYLLALIDDKPVAMTGLVFNESLQALELGWTCTLPEYRQQGIMHSLIEHIITWTDEKIYCSAWHLSNKKHINLYHIISDYGFEGVVPARVTCNSKYNCCETLGMRCVNYQSVNHAPCTCTEDLWLRPARKNK